METGTPQTSKQCSVRATPPQTDQTAPGRPDGPNRARAPRRTKPRPGATILPQTLQTAPGSRSDGNGAITGGNWPFTSQLMTVLVSDLIPVPPTADIS